MEKLTKYRQIVQEALLEHGKQKNAYGDVEVETIFDKERDHYQIVYVGWEEKNWIHSCVLHIDIKDGKIWIQWNGTEDDIAADFVEQGVSKEDIVIGFHHPSMRKFTKYAVG
ncbi:fdxN element excision controlling factor protein [Calothrix sp. NIES-4071]|nr:fdxN element excision controlling factor protein [Calothrix sp. NIES-4071]BAZ60530.1 fdxN element excision controlling factor protein [Calothrix sp. NIES-4105]